MGPIAIIGMAGRFPGAPDVDRFWENLRDGVESVSFFSDEELRQVGVDASLLRNPRYIRARAIVEDSTSFDAAFFGINPREAEVIDPQHRLFLECAWEAMENAGYEPRGHARPIGVYAGTSINSYLLANVIGNAQVVQAVGGYQLMLASDKDFLTTRVSYKLNLRGPSVNIQTACSTSLVAVQFACQGLLTRQCDLALAGGVSLMFPQRAGYLYQPGMILSPDGHCRPFDADAHGTIGGEGVGIVVLKRLADALADGDTIRAVIKGAAVNNDGSTKIGYTAPSIDGQAEVITMAHAMAGIEPETVTYIEAHGTATELGDPIEVAALTKAFQARTDARGFCAIGSVKSNIGHLDAAAGVAGLIKTVLALEHGAIPPSLHFVRPNENIDFAASPFFVNDALRPWSRERGPRRAGVSSFGIGGTNAHAVLEEAPAVAAGDPGAPVQLLTLSARTPAALEQVRRRLAAHLAARPSLDMADVAYTLQLGRRAFPYRAAVVCRGVPDAVEALTDPAKRGRVSSADEPALDRTVAFLFPGQGAQYVDMARGLYEQEPVFRAQVDACAAAIEGPLGVDLRTILYPAAGTTDGAEARLRQTSLAQPAIFVVEYALASLWMHWGLRPDAMIGHSIGEYVAACLAGVMTLDEALRLVVERGRLMQIPGGGMLAVSLAEERLAGALGPELCIAAVNAPALCVVSGPEAPLAALERKLTGERVACQRLHTAHAFHSTMMAPALAPFAEAVRRVRLRPPTIPYVSNVTGTWITAEEATDPGYWVRHLREAVRFSAGLTRLLEDPSRILLEVGPGHTLASLARQHQPAGRLIVSSVRHPRDPQPDADVLLNALGRLWVAGAPVEWSALHAGARRRRVPLPSYPFERQRYCVEPVAPAPAPSKRAELANWFYTPRWRRTAVRATPGSAAARWLVFLDAQGLGAAVVERLRAGGRRVVTVQPGRAFSEHGPDDYVIDPDDRAHYLRLVTMLTANDAGPLRVVDLWTIAGADVDATVDESDRAGSRAFYSLLFLAQAFAERAVRERVEMLVVSNALYDVTGEAVRAPARAAALGPCIVLPQEFPNVTCRLVDVQLGHDDTASAELADQVVGELDEALDGTVAAYRGPHRWVLDYEPVRLPAAEPETRLRRGGVYLITGGFGGIGGVLARDLARTLKAKLVLVGRGPIPPREEWPGWKASHAPDDATSARIGLVQDLEALGSEVLPLSADVSVPRHVEHVVEAARARFGRIDGVIHGAGLPGGGIVQLKTRQAADAVLQPKTTGTAALIAALAKAPPDFVLLCSSITAILGGPGQVDYCGANSVLDAFARFGGDGPRPPVVSVNWDVWGDVGMAVNTAVPEAFQKQRAAELAEGIASAEGIDAFRRILASGLREVVVSTHDFALRTALARQAGRPRDARPADGAAAATRASRPAPPDTAAASAPVAGPTTDLERTIVQVWEELLGIPQIGMNDDFFEAGGHSLLATQMMARLHQRLAIDIPLREIFEARTVAAFAERVRTLLPEGDDNREEIEI